MKKWLFERDKSRNSGDILAKQILDTIRKFEYPPKELYDVIADYAEKEGHSILLLKLGLVEPQNNKAIKELENLRLVNKPIEYFDHLGRRKLQHG